MFNNMSANRHYVNIADCNIVGKLGFGDARKHDNIDMIFSADFKVLY